MDDAGHLRQTGLAPPRMRPPPGACDTHVHIFAPGVAAAPGAVKPLPEGADLDTYRAVQAALGLTRAVLVQPTHYGADNAVQLAALDALGPSARMVAVLDAGVGDADLEDLHRRGVRGVRFHLPGPDPVAALTRMAGRIAPLGWHVEVQVDGATLAQVAPGLRGLPCPLVIAHGGRLAPGMTAEHPAMVALRRLVDAGTWVKLSAPYVMSRLGPPGYADVSEQMGLLLALAPDRMLWASNWPHTTPAVAPPETVLLDFLLDLVEGDAGRYGAILADNAARLYGFRGKMPTAEC